MHCTIKVKNFCALHNRRPRSWPECSLIGPKPFPVPQEKFPVLVFRELASYPLIYRQKSRDWLTFGAIIGNLPCIFPLNRERASETGSQMTAPTANMALMFSDSVHASAFIAFGIKSLRARDCQRLVAEFLAWPFF